MKTPSRFLITLFACAGLASIVTAGPEPIAQSYKESKEVVPPAPPPCDWSGVYIGLHAGGQFGHSEINDLDEYNFFAHHHFGFSESGFVGGGQVGYNWQWHCLVLGPEFDVGYMDLDGSGVEPGRFFGGDTHGETNSDFYVTLRGRVGVSVDWQGCWLFYATGGAIGVNYTTKFNDHCITGDCGDGTVDARGTDFNWGPTVGGGIERQIGRHWSIKLEYLFFALDQQSFSGIARSFPDDVAPQGVDFPRGKTMSSRVDFEGETEGHIIRGGLNFRF